MLLKKRVKTIGNNGRELVHYLVHRPGTLYLHDNDWVAASVLCKKASTRQMVEAFDAELATRQQVQVQGRVPACSAARSAARSTARSTVRGAVRGAAQGAARGEGTREQRR